MHDTVEIEYFDVYLGRNQQGHLLNNDYFTNHTLGHVVSTAFLNQ